MLEDGDKIIYESAIIDEYLDEQYPQVPLMPRDPAVRARARIWIDFCNTRLQRAGGNVAHDHNVEQSKAEIKDYLAALEREVSARDYIAGDYSLADITFIPFFTRLERYQTTIGDNLPNIKSWMKRLLDRPAVRQTL